MKQTFVFAALLFAATSTLTAQVFKPNSLVLSTSMYVGDASTVTIGETLPPVCVAQTVTLDLLTPLPPPPASPTMTTTTAKVKCGAAFADGSYPTVFNNGAKSGTYPTAFTNGTSDGSFGVTSPIILLNLSTEGAYLGSYEVPSDEIVTSFPSKSELALNRSTDGKSISFIGYAGGTSPSGVTYTTGPNQLDVSNSNTPGVFDPTNPVISTYYRAVGDIDANGHLQVTPFNAFSGDNGRSVIKANGVYYAVGNDNNGGLKGGALTAGTTLSQLTDTQDGLDLIHDTGVEYLDPGQAPANHMIGDFEASPDDKPGKDNNFRGVTIFGNTLYVTKGSGSNGINTIYQVGSAGQLPSGSASDLSSVSITIPQGFPTTPASGPGEVSYPFGMFFANANTLYVCDEGDGNLESPDASGNVASTDAQTHAGIQKWGYSNGSWQLLYTLNNGLNIGVPYSVPNYPTALNPATDGCRNLTGKANANGTVELFAVTSTVSASGDQGADPNKLVKVTDSLNATAPSAHGNGLDMFETLRSAQYGEVFRGVAFAPEK